MPKSLETQLQEVAKQLEATPDDQELTAKKEELQSKIDAKAAKSKKGAGPKDIETLRKSKDYAYFKEADPVVMNPITNKPIGKTSETVQVSVGIHEIDTYLLYRSKGKIVECICHPDGDEAMKEINKKLNGE